MHIFTHSNKHRIHYLKLHDSIYLHILHHSHRRNCLLNCHATTSTASVCVNKLVHTFSHQVITTAKIVCITHHFLIILCIETTRLHIHIESYCVPNEQFAFCLWQNNIYSVCTRFISACMMAKGVACFTIKLHLMCKRALLMVLPDRKVRQIWEREFLKGTCVVGDALRAFIVRCG